MKHEKPDVDTSLLPEVLPPRRRATLQDRLTVVRYALAARAKYDKELEGRHRGFAEDAEERGLKDEKLPKKPILRQGKRKSTHRRKHYRRGLNIELLCRTKFGELVKGAKVCRWMRQYEVEKWELVPEEVRRKVYDA